MSKLNITLSTYRVKRFQTLKKGQICMQTWRVFAGGHTMLTTNAEFNGHSANGILHSKLKNVTKPYPFLRIAPIVHKTEITLGGTYLESIGAVPRNVSGSNYNLV